jgi:alpha-methylacyl-CoA racemase
VARESFVEVDGMLHPAPAPRFSRTRPEIAHGPRPVGADSEEILAGWGFSAEQIAALRANGAVAGSG